MDLLNKVITAKEAEKAYRINRVTIARACREGWVKARKSAGTWLIEKASADARWGNEHKS
jgi:hypothetical protein